MDKVLCPVEEGEESVNLTGPGGIRAHFDPKGRHGVDFFGWEFDGSMPDALTPRQTEAALALVVTTLSDRLARLRDDIADSEGPS